MSVLLCFDCCTLIRADRALYNKRAMGASEWKTGVTALLAAQLLLQLQTDIRTRNRRNMWQAATQVVS